MPASNRRPLLDGADTPPALDINQVHVVPPTQQTQLSTPAAAGSSTAVQQGFKQPCTLKGAASALYAGALGYFLGVMPAAIKYKGRQWGMVHTQGLASAQQLAVMSGMYTAVHCICQRIRMVEDGWNRGIAGCSTGLVLGWSNGPWSALQSCAGVGLISALIDLGGGVEAAEARTMQPLQHNHAHYYSPQHQLRPYALQQEQQQGSSALADLPKPMQLLALMLGVPPSSISSAGSSTAGRSATDTPADQPPATHASRGSRDTKQQADASLHLGGEVQPDRIGQQQRQHRHQRDSFLQHQQQQPPPLVSAAMLGHSAAVAVQQLLAAPPLMFLGACCHPGGSLATAAAADVDACPVAVASAGKAASSRRH